MGAGSAVVGVGSYARWPTDVEELPRLGGLIDPNLELMISLRPRVAMIDAGQRDLAEQLRAAGMRSYAFHHGDLDLALRTMAEIGEAVGMRDAGQQLSLRIGRELEELREVHKSARPPRTLVVYGRRPGSFRQLYVFGGGSFIHELLSIAGGENVFEDVDMPSFKAGLETIMAKAPEVVIESQPARQPPVDRQALVDEWHRLPGFKKVHVGVLVASPIGVPGPRMPETVRLIAAELDQVRE